MIAGLTPQPPELGRIRIGEQTATADGNRPARLDTFRFTSPREELIAAVADQLGGTPRRWDDAPGAQAQWEVVTEADTVDILLPPMALDQHMELWSGGGLQRRCDGQTMLVPDDGAACVCPADPDERQTAAGRGKACKPTTRLRTVIPWLPGVGTWLLVTHGWYAAAELAGVTGLLSAPGRGLIPAQLHLATRTVKRPGEKPKHFPVPRIHITEKIGAVLEALGLVLDESRPTAIDPFSGEPRPLPITQTSQPAGPPAEPAEPTPTGPAAAAGDGGLGRFSRGITAAADRTALSDVELDELVYRVTDGRAVNPDDVTDPADANRVIAELNATRQAG